MPSSANLLLPNNHIGATLFFTQCLIVLFSYSSSYAPLFCRKTRYLTTYLGVRILLCCRNRHVYAYIYKKNTSPQKMVLMQWIKQMIKLDTGCFHALLYWATVLVLPLIPLPDAGSRWSIEKSFQWRSNIIWSLLCLSGNSFKANLCCLWN